MVLLLQTQQHIILTPSGFPAVAAPGRLGGNRRGSGCAVGGCLLVLAVVRSAGGGGSLVGLARFAERERGGVEPELEPKCIHAVEVIPAPGPRARKRERDKEKEARARERKRELKEKR